MISRARRLWILTLLGVALTGAVRAQVVPEFPIPTPDSGPFGITAGPDGNLWFTESVGNKIGRISPDGVIAEFPVPTVGTHPLSIVAGPDGNLWFTDLGGNWIVKVLNGCSLNGHSWVFAGGLTNVGVSLTVTDTQTGVAKTYTNPPNAPFQPIQDTAFSSCP